MNAPARLLLIVAVLQCAGCAGAFSTGAFQTGAFTPGGADPAPEPPSEVQVSADQTASASLYLQVIRKLQEKSLHYAALAHIEAFEKQWPREFREDIALLRAAALRQTGRAEAARGVYADLLDTPAAGSAHHGLGLVAARQGDLPGALAEFRRAVELAPTNAAFLNDYGYALLDAGDLGAARDTLFKAVELDPKDKRAGANLALLLYLRGETGRADDVVRHYGLSPEVTRRIRARLAERPADREATQSRTRLQPTPQTPIRP